MTSATLIPRLRTDLAAARFTVPGLTGLWGIEADAALFRNQRVPARRALAALATTLGRNEPAATLARLFLLSEPVSSADLDAALPTLRATGAEQLGLVVVDGVAGDGPAGDADAGVRPIVDLRPYSFIDAHGAGSWWIVSDLGELALGHPLGETHVLGIGGASRTLSGLMMPGAVGRALDIGTGCGIQAMHASRHAEHVVATDISVRALELAALNAGLNEIDNIEFRLGSLYEPVAGERFDHIISNPPFVITPRAEGVPSYEYRDGGMVGDALVEAVVRGAADHLTPGGVAQLLGNWEYPGETDAFERLDGWLTPVVGLAAHSSEAHSQKLDAWIIEREVQSPGEYAETWIRDGGTRPGPDFDRLYDAWLNDFDARDVRRVGFGYLLLRLPVSAPTLRRLERMPGALGHNPAGLGAHLAECLAAHDWQAQTDDARLLSTQLTVASDVTEERHYWPGQPDPTVMTLHQGSGFGRAVPLDTALAGLVGACDGDLAVGAIIGALAQLLDADEVALSAELLPKVRDLVADGFLTVPEPV
ncbi:methyltransferase domain-containing protein [Cryobacterium sp. TMT1-3]|uniref:Methyltransferase domain-containing protein n=1 Tax=Cryobacterium luteum TaxID=1424661 RepID=A0A5F0DAA6_9MICO|nr:MULTISPECIES: methyltransferase [Cryobacterium]TFB93307.1 methyltransferase domain-containing protein [Cryobacterium luteum]TFC28748.1 methyltransferase domain-containing protein [Cryobacterium sp. TMT1-3]